jgi:heme/copper-type cytochrome/quinol oxidase subunit 4
VPQVPASHFLFMVLYALLVSLVFAMLLRDDRGAQVKTAGMMFGGFVAAAVVLSWLMFPFPL